MELVRDYFRKAAHNQLASAPSGLDWAALIYLVLPLILFIFSWTHLLIGIPAGLLTAYSVCEMPKNFSKPNWMNITIALIVYFFTVRYSGISPWINSVPLLDITKHRWLLNDLFNHSWPVHLTENGTGYILRYSLGFYIIPSLLSKLLGYISQTPFLIWMMLGTFLFLLFVLQEVKYRWLIIPVVLAVVFFGGLDVIGVILTTPHRTGAGLGEFSEDWAINPYGWLIASNSFAFSWSPQHAIAGWLGGALLLRNWDKVWFQRRFLGVMTALAFWSPFTALSFGGIFIFLFLRQFVRGERSYAAISIPNVCAIFPLIIIYNYYTLGHATDGGLNTAFTWDFIGLYLRFISIEFGIFSVLCFVILRERTTILTACVAILLFYPMFRIGGAVNDLVMSGSRLPLMILMIFVIRAIQEDGHKIARIVLAMLACVGVYGGFNETYRLLHAPKVQADWTASILLMDPNYRPQYIAPVPTGVRAWIFPGCLDARCENQR